MTTKKAAETSATEKVVETAIDQITENTLQTQGENVSEKEETTETQGEDIQEKALEPTEPVDATTPVDATQAQAQQINTTKDSVDETAIIEKLKKLFASRNNYSHIVCGRHLKNGITKDAILAFGKEFPSYGIGESIDSEVLDLIKLLQ